MNTIGKSISSGIGGAITGLSVGTVRSAYNCWGPVLFPTFKESLSGNVRALFGKSREQVALDCTISTLKHDALWGAGIFVGLTLAQAVAQKVFSDSKKPA